LTGSAGSSENWELKTVFSEQVWLGSSDFVLGVKNDCSDDWNCVGWGSVVTGHFLVQLTDSSVQGNISVLLIHVVDSSSGLIFQDDSESLDVVGSSFEDFVDWENLTLCAFGLEESSQMVPEFGFGDDVVSCEQSQSINLGTGVLFGWKLSSHNKELSDLK
jgi:hypothetical protein